MKTKKTTAMEPLAKLIVLLNHGQPVSPTRIMTEFSVTRKSAYDRLEKLKVLGCKLSRIKLREGARGPMVWGYSIIINRAAKKIVRGVVAEIVKDYDSVLAA